MPDSRCPLKTRSGASPRPRHSTAKHQAIELQTLLVLISYKAKPESNLIKMALLDCMC